MSNFTGDISHDPQAFEDFLADQGFSRARAKAITKKGFGVSGARIDEHEVAALVEYVEAKRERLEQKGWFVSLARWVGQTLLETAISEGAKAAIERLLVALERPRDKTTTPMPITLLATGSRSAEFYLRTRLDQPEIKYEVVTAGAKTSEHLFQCTIHYTEWRPSGPTKKTLVLSNLKGQSPVVRGKAIVGGYQAMQAWLARASASDIEEARRGFESGKYQPHGTIEYYGHILAGVEDFKVPDSARFIIRDGASGQT